MNHPQVSPQTIALDTPESGICVLSLNRPHIYNAINRQMMMELEAFWKDRLWDAETKVIVLRGNGEKGFCSGWDLNEAAELASREIDMAEIYDYQARLSRMSLAMRQVPQPIVCAVHGAAAGGGFTFALASDIRVIATDARFSAAYMNVGLGGADQGSSYFLPRLIGSGRAYEFLLTGGFMSAQEAMDLGLASRMVESDQLLDAAMDYARVLNSKSALALRMTKEAINLNIDAAGLEQALNLEDRNQAYLATMLQLKVINEQREV